MDITKTPSQSKSEQVQIVLAPHINGKGRLFGGQLMAWIDTLGGVVARRHSEHEVITAAVDNLVFGEGVEMNSTLILVGCVTWTGHTSMEIRVDTFIEDLHGNRKRVNRAYLVFVAVDDDFKPVQVPQLKPETEAEIKENEMAQIRQHIRLNRRRDNF